MTAYLTLVHNRFAVAARGDGVYEAAGEGQSSNDVVEMHCVVEFAVQESRRLLQSRKVNLCEGGYPG